MSKHRPLLYGQPLPQDFLDALQELLGTYNANVIIDQPTSTSVRIVSGTGNGQVGIAIGGMWRYNTATVTAAHPGGAAGQYDIYVVASANSFTAGAGNETDNTDYTFGLVIVAHNATPTGTWNSRAIAATRKIGELTWSGTVITAINNMLEQPVSTTIAPGTITQPMLATDSVGAAQIQADSVGSSELAPGSVTDVEVAAANKDGVVGTASMRTLGVGAQQAAAGNDSRLSDARTPTVHASTHFGAGAPDPVDLVVVNPQTGSYTLVTADRSKMVEINSAGAATLTIPTNAAVAFPVGSSITVMQTGAGQVTIAGAGGVTVNATPGLKIAAQWGIATLIKRATDTWVVTGNLSP